MRKSWLSWCAGLLGGWGSSWGREEGSNWVRGTSTRSSLKVPSAEAWPAGSTPTPAQCSASLPAVPQLSLAPSAQAPPLRSEGAVRLYLGILAEPEEGHAPLWGTCDFPLAAFRCFLTPNVLKCVCVFWILLGSRLSLLPLPLPPSLCLLLLKPQAPSFLTQHLCLRVLCLGSLRACALLPACRPLQRGLLLLSLSS